jgi:hypothetical protein
MKFVFSAGFCKLTTNWIHVNHSATNKIKQIIIKLSLFVLYMAKYIGRIKTAKPMDYKHQSETVLQ